MIIDDFAHSHVEEALNPAAYGFWLKYSTAYAHSVVRRIDELIIDNNNKL